MPTYYVNPSAGNAFVLIAFTIVVLGGMGSVAGRAGRRTVRRRGREPVRALSRRVARPDRHLRDVHPGPAVPAERPVRSARMKALAPILAARGAARHRAADHRVERRAQFPGDGALSRWSARAGTCSAATAASIRSAMRRSSAPAPMSPRILQMRYGVNAWAGFVDRHRRRRAGRRVHRRAELPLRAEGLLLRAGDARLRRGAAHRRQRRADHRRRRRHADQARSAARGLPVPEPRAVLLDRARHGRRVARSSFA